MTGPVTGIRRRRGVAGRRETPHLPPDRDFYGQTLFKRCVGMKRNQSLDVFRVLDQHEKRRFASQLGKNAKAFRKTLVSSMSCCGKALIFVLSIAPWLYMISEWAVARPMWHWGRKLWR